MAETQAAAIREVVRGSGRDRAKEDRAAVAAQYEHRAQEPQETDQRLDSPPEPTAEA